MFEVRETKKNNKNPFDLIFPCKISTMPSLSTEESLDHQINEDGHNDNTLSGPIIGIIYPPPEVRSKFNLKENVLHAIKNASYRFLT